MPEFSALDQPQVCILSYHHFVDRYIVRMATWTRMVAVLLVASLLCSAVVCNPPLGRTIDYGDLSPDTIPFDRYHKINCCLWRGGRPCKSLEQRFQCSFTIMPPDVARRPTSSIIKLRTPKIYLLD